MAERDRAAGVPGAGAMTMIHTHVLNRSGLGVKSPLDFLEEGRRNRRCAGPGRRKRRKPMKGQGIGEPKPVGSSTLLCCAGAS